MAAITNVKDLFDTATQDLLEDLEQEPYELPEPSGEFQSAIFVDQIKNLIEWQLLNPEQHRQVPCFLGSTGIGKTESIRAGVRAAAEKMGRPMVDDRGEDTFHEIMVSQMGPVDILGVPREDKLRTVFRVPRIFPIVAALPEHEAAYQKFLQDYQAKGEADWSIMRDFPVYALFFDEVTNPASPQIVHQCFSIWHGLYVADHKLVSDTAVFLAGNRVTDRTGSISLAASATTRLSMIEVLPRLSGWLRDYAMKPVFYKNEEYTRINPLVIAFLDRNPHEFAPKPGAISSMTPFPNPRAWDFVSRDLYTYDRHPDIPEEVLNAKIAGRIGDATAANFATFRKYWQKVPSVTRMLNSEAKPGSKFGWLPQEWPTEIDIKVIMATQMVTKLNASNAERFMDFMLDEQYFSAEFSTMAMKMLRPAGKVEPLAETWAREKFSQWAHRYARMAV